MNTKKYVKAIAAWLLAIALAAGFVFLFWKTLFFRNDLDMYNFLMGEFLLGSAAMICAGLSVTIIINELMIKDRKTKLRVWLSGMKIMGTLLTILLVALVIVMSIIAEDDYLSLLRGKMVMTCASIIATVSIFVRAIEWKINEEKEK